MLDILSGASPIVLAVLALLVVASIASWAVIVQKFRELSAADRHTRAFLEAYQETSIENVYSDVRRYSASPLAAVFRAGFREFAQLERKQGGAEKITPQQAESVIKRLTWLQADQAQRLERGLAFLATTGSAAPFVGLFGTVVGIMNAFHQIGQTGSPSFQVVAPSIAEALFATAVGLFAAIPAVVAYNYSNARLARLSDRLGAFCDEFYDLLRRSVGGTA
jgi:biopolymer transport protein TolQ